MKKPIFYSIVTILTLSIGFLIFGNDHHQPINDQEILKLSKSFGDKFSQMRESQSQAQPSNSKSNSPESNVEDQNSQAIIGIIYNKPASTWFIKAKDSKSRIESISASFTQYFLTELKFNSDHQPDFSHLPKGSKITSTSSMRFATFIINGVEISVINLPGKQDTFSNIKRWMGQVGLNDESPISMKFFDNKSTIFVKMPK